jgi:3'-phosphoadenosine 5'-phosphosulfate sulfotransferase (PAPS reductase)/FAD synthetase
MINKVKHVLGISGGKDSAALAIYLHDKYPSLSVQYYFCDTGKELDETYELIEKLESYLGEQILKIKAAEDSPAENPFDHFMELYGGFIPSAQARWCTKKLKLEPFENEIVRDDLSISYVGIRGDENREGYISKKPNIQSIFPFRKNIWSEDVIRMTLRNENIDTLINAAADVVSNSKLDLFVSTLSNELTPNYPQKRKLNDLLAIGITEFNRIVYKYLQSTDMPLAFEENFPLIDNEDNLVRDDIFRILEESGVGIPAYYKKLEFEVDGKKGFYSRSRSGCFFCFFQQKIEWVWLYENHKHLFDKAIEYEKDGYTWMQDEKLIDLAKADRIRQIKLDYIKKTERNAQSQNSEFLIDNIQMAEGEGCNACFI